MNATGELSLLDQRVALARAELARAQFALSKALQERDEYMKSLIIPGWDLSREVDYGFSL